jgi:hypothetical protein
MGKTLICAKLWNQDVVAFMCIILESSDRSFIGTHKEGEMSEGGGSRMWDSFSHACTTSGATPYKEVQLPLN